MSFGQIEAHLIDWWPKAGRDPADGDRDIALAAWVSTYDRARAEAKQAGDVTRLLAQLIDREDLRDPQDDVPKENVWLKFFLTVPIFTERQYDKYRMTIQAQDFQIDWYEAPFGRWGITQSEMSGRYRTIPDRPYTLPSDVALIMREVGLPQASEGYAAALNQQHATYSDWLSLFPQSWRLRGDLNNWKYKRCREVLRGVLGTAFLTDMRIVLNLNAFEHLLSQRLHPSAQMESRVLAARMFNAVQAAAVAPQALHKLQSACGWTPWLDQINRQIGEYVGGTSTIGL